MERIEAILTQIVEGQGDGDPEQEKEDGEQGARGGKSRRAVRHIEPGAFNPSWQVALRQCDYF